LSTANAWVNRKRGQTQTKCKACQKAYTYSWLVKNRDKERARAKAYYALHKEHLKVVYDASRVRRKYGMTPEQIKRKKAAQDGLCVICKLAPAVAVDHCHKTKVTRDILCGQCNAIIGLAKENPATLRAAALYVEVWAEKTQEILAQTRISQPGLFDGLELRQVLCVKG
jgi:hypothetical protein